MSDKLKEVNCPNCGHNLLDKNYDYNPRKRLTILQLARNKDLMREIRKVVQLIKKNVTSDNSVLSEYYFMKRIESIKDTVVRIGMHRYLEGHHVYGGKGFAYLSRIIQYTETNSERQFELEQKRLGTLPKPQRKEDING